MQPFPREFYLPKGAAKGAAKVADKLSDAVAYLYNVPDGAPAAALFVGRQSKPLWRFRFASLEQREKRIREAFASRRGRLEHKAGERQARKAAGRGVEVGHILVSSWGYEQTNIDWFEVVALVGQTMAEIRPIAAIDASKGGEPWMTGKCLPAAGSYTGPARRVVVKQGHCKVGHQHAWVWDGQPRSWSSYH